MAEEFQKHAICAVCQPLKRLSRKKIRLGTGLVYKVMYGIFQSFGVAKLSAFGFPTAARSCASALFPWAAALLRSVSAKKYGTT
jgi:hypothetical protein